MKYLISILILFNLCSKSDFRKRNLPYGVLISEADLIVEGRIANHNSNLYEFKVNEFIKGNSSPVINVEIWQEWNCDKRIKAIKKGQKLLLFLKKEKKSYKIINGSTGELFILEDGSVEAFLKNDFPKIKEVKKGIKLFLKSYKYKGKLYPGFNEEYYFEKLTDQSEINKMRQENEFMNFLVSEISDYEHKK